MFTEEEFKRKLNQQCSYFGLYCKGAWSLSENVFVAQIKESFDSDHNTLSFLFYYDVSETKQRDIQFVNRVVQLLLIGGTVTGDLSEEEGDDARVFFFEGSCPIGTLNNALNFATQMFIQENGDEIPWLDSPKEVAYQI